MSRPRLVAYARYLLGDFLLQRAALPLILILFVVGLPLYGTLRHSPAGFWETRQGLLFAKQMFTQGVTLFLPLGAFLGAVGVLSQDRQQGHFRFYFSKPVTVPAYYAFTYALHGVVFVALFGLITWVYGSLTVHQPVRAALAAAALTFVLIGGLGFLFGALLRLDGALVAVSYIVAMTLQQLAAHPSGGLPNWAVQLSRVLPPAYALDQVRNQLYAAEAVSAGQLWHVIGYGAGAFVLGLFVVRKAPLAR